MITKILFIIWFIGLSFGSVGDPVIEPFYKPVFKSLEGNLNQVLGHKSKNGGLYDLFTFKV